MNLLEVIPWRRAFVHADAACLNAPIQDRIAHLALVLLYTSLPIVTLYAFAFSITWITVSSLTALFLLTVGDFNRGPIERLYYSVIEGVPGWLVDRGFRKIYNPPADGSCFFQAVAHGIDIPENEVRAAIADWIEVNVAPERGIHWEQFKAQWSGMGEPELRDVQTYVKRIRDGDLEIWGDHLEAQAIAEAQSISVRVHWEGANPQQHGAFERGIDLYYTVTALGGHKNHYKLLLR